MCSICDEACESCDKNEEVNERRREVLPLLQAQMEVLKARQELEKVQARALRAESKLKLHLILGMEKKEESAVPDWEETIPTKYNWEDTEPNTFETTSAPIDREISFKRNFRST